MNNTEPKQKNLLELYVLLWEQIKKYSDKFSLIEITGIMLENGLITDIEESLLDNDILIYRGFGHSKESFVQQQIEKLKNKE